MSTWYPNLRPLIPKHRGVACCQSVRPLTVREISDTHTHATGLCRDLLLDIDITGYGLAIQSLGNVYGAVIMAEPLQEFTWFN